MCPNGVSSTLLALAVPCILVARGRYGYCGVLGPLAWRALGAKIVAFDVVSEEPIRGPDGFLVTVGRGQVRERGAQLPTSASSEKWCLTVTFVFTIFC